MSRHYYCNSGGGGNGGCGCLTLIITILALCALWFGLPTSWGKLNIDIFPPAVYLEK